MRQKRFLIFLTFLLLSGLGVATFFLWNRYGPSTQVSPDYSQFPVPTPVGEHEAACKLAVTRYRQVGNELQLLLYAGQPALAPFDITITDGDTTLVLEAVYQRPGSWLRFTPDGLPPGPALLQLQSRNDTNCSVSVNLLYRHIQDYTLADTSMWFRQGSDDDLLDVRVAVSGDKFILRDFSGYRDNRRRTYLIDGIVVPDLDKGVEVKPGYLYTVAAKWIDAPYPDWWNRLRSRTSRQQIVWIKPRPASAPEAGPLTPIRIPDAYIPSPDFSPVFDTLLPPFPPLANKLVMQYRLNNDISPERYFARGITHLPRWQDGIPRSKQHWTEYPGFFDDKDQQWFSGLTREEVEGFADKVGEIGVFAYDFEFWNQAYSPEVKQRLVWFSRRIRQNCPTVYLFDYWGGAAYHNKNFVREGIQPLKFVADYTAPRPNHFNFEKTADGDFLGNYFNISPVDVYPKPIHGSDADGNTPNNYLVLSALHASRINKLIPFQKQNKVIWYAWNRHMPYYNDPAIPWHRRTRNPEGELVFHELETMPASQALALSLFSLVTADGYYLWHDSQPWGRGRDNYAPDLNDKRTEWFPADGRTPSTAFRKEKNVPESPRYWDYPTDFFVLGNRMASQVGDILAGGTVKDLPYCVDGKWQIPESAQAPLAAHRKDPFVTSVVNKNQIVVLALDSFQPPYKTRKLPIRLPDGTETTLSLYGNWPALYRGTLRVAQTH